MREKQSCIDSSSIFLKELAFAWKSSVQLKDDKEAFWITVHWKDSEQLINVAIGRGDEDFKHTAHSVEVP